MGEGCGLEIIKVTRFQSHRQALEFSGISAAILPFHFFLSPVSFHSPYNFSALQPPAEILIVVSGLCMQPVNYLFL